MRYPVVLHINGPQSLIPRWMMGMGKVTERLGNPVFKMASVAMADAISEERGREEIFVRPFHDAFLANKVVCPVAECVENVLFFEEPGLPLNFRVAHKKHVTPEDMKNSALTMKRLHAEETLRYIQYQSDKKSRVRPYF